MPREATPPDEQLIPDNRQARVQQIVNTGGDAVNGGLQGAILKYAQTSIVTLFLILYSYMMWYIISTGRQDRMEDRQLFRDSVKDIQHEADRRAGEVRGSTDKLIDVVRQNSEVVQKWIEESRRERAEHGKPARTAEPKAPAP